MPALLPEPRMTVSKVVCTSASLFLNLPVRRLEAGELIGRTPVPWRSWRAYACGSHSCHGLEPREKRVKLVRAERVVRRCSQLFGEGFDSVPGLPAGLGEPARGVHQAAAAQLLDKVRVVALDGAMTLMIGVVALRRCALARVFGRIAARADRAQSPARVRSGASAYGFAVLTTFTTGASRRPPSTKGCRPLFSSLRRSD